MDWDVFKKEKINKHTRKKTQPKDSFHNPQSIIGRKIEINEFICTNDEETVRHNKFPIKVRHTEEKTSGKKQNKKTARSKKFTHSIKKNMKHLGQICKVLERS